MNFQKHYFFKWLKQNTTAQPHTDIDQSILLMAERKLNQIAGHKRQNFFHFLGFSSSLLLLVVSINVLTNTKSNTLSLIEPPEMIMNYNFIELMAEASVLSDEDWNAIEGKNEIR